MWLSNMRLVLPEQILEKGSLRIADGKIAEIIEGEVQEGINTNGLTAVPGIVDLHGDMLERDIEPRPRARFPADLALFELDKRMAGAGITTAYAAVAFAWNSSDLRRKEVAEEIIRTSNTLRDTLLVDTYIHARFEMKNDETIPLITRLLEEDLIQLISLMDHTPGQGQYGDKKRFVSFINEWLGFSEDPIGEQLEQRMDEKIAEVQAAARDWSLVQEVVNVALQHNVIIASHDDDKPTKVYEQADLGVTISEFPVTMEAAIAAKDRGMHVIMGAPNAYRGESNTGNLSALEAIKAGLVDILATDYFPSAPLHAMFRIANDGIMPLYEASKLVSFTPADAMGLHDRGKLEVGMSADMVLVEETVQPRVRATLRHGTPIYWDSYMAHLSQEQAVPYIEE